MDEKQLTQQPEEETTMLPEDFAQKILDSVPPIEDIPLAAPQTTPNGATMQYQAPQPQNMQNGGTMQYQVPQPQNMQNGGTMQYQTPQPQNMQNGGTMQYQAPQPQNMQNGGTMQYQVPQPQNMQNGGTMHYQAPQPSTSDSPKKKSRKGRKGLWIGLSIGGGVVVLAGIILTILLLTGVFSNFTVDFSEFYEIKVEGYDGYGKAEVVLKDTASEMIASDERYQVLNTATFTLTKEDHIKNGETIEATVNYDQAFAEEKRITITNQTLTVTAENLEEANVVDPFEFLTISVDGISPVATISLVDESETKLFTYGFKNEVTYVKNGDEITIVASYDEAEFEEKGLVAAETEMTYKVENLAEYVMSTDMLTNNMRLLINESTGAKLENVLKSNRYSIIYKINDPDFSFMSSLSFKDITVEKSYLLTKNTPDNWSANNMVYDQYKLTAVLSQNGNEREYTMYALVGVSDLIEENGALRPIEANNVTFYLSYLGLDASTLYDDVFKGYEQNYTITEMPAP